MIIDLPHPAKKGPWTESELTALRNGYAHRRTPHELARLLGRSAAAVRNKAYDLRITNPTPEWTEVEIARLREVYECATLRGGDWLGDLARKVGRHKTNVCRKARELGLTDSNRKYLTEPRDRRKYKTHESLRAAMSERLKRSIAENGHPRGMAGKHHTAEVRRRIGEKTKARARSMSAEERSNIVLKAMRTKVEKYGSAGSPRPHATWKAGWREIGGKRKYYRSRWEANYARYLEWLKQQGQIADWQHEPETFWFEAIKRGVRSYLPDFRVWENDGSAHLHEVKGWMDARSKTTLKRMAKYHPQERIVVIREKAYNDIARKVGGIIEGWEHSERAGRW